MQSACMRYGQFAQSLSGNFYFAAKTGYDMISRGIFSFGI